VEVFCGAAVGFVAHEAIEYDNRAVAGPAHMTVKSRHINRGVYQLKEIILRYGGHGE
jgi:hypothetical protein